MVFSKQDMVYLHHLNSVLLITSIKGMSQSKPWWAYSMDFTAAYSHIQREIMNMLFVTSLAMSTLRELSLRKVIAYSYPAASLK